MTNRFVSYAQNLEDVFLYRCFRHRQGGYYIDVGASHPVVDSPTYAFYLRGWSGLNVEPIEQRAIELQRLRPRDLTICAAAGAATGEVKFFRTDGMGGLSSCVPRAVSGLRSAGPALDEKTVRVLTLDDLCDEHAIDNAQFLKIDVEGYESDVLSGFSFLKCRPEVVIVEAVSPAGFEVRPVWAERLVSLDYRRAYDDGLNLFFVRDESEELLRHFATQVSVLDAAVQFTAQGFCLVRTDHPDHAWAIGLSRHLLDHLTRLSADESLLILTTNIVDAALNASVDLDSINRAFYLVLGRWVTVEEVEPIAARGVAGLRLRDLIRELLDGDEYLQRLGRAAASF